MTNFTFVFKLFENCLMGANDDLEGKKTHLADFYIHTISGQNILKPSIVVIELWPLSINTG